MIKGPKNAIPTLKGWVSPKGELLKAQKITQAQIDEWNGVKAKPAPEPEPVVVEAEPEVLVQEELEVAPEPEPVAVSASSPKPSKTGAIRRAIKNTFKR